MKLSISKLTLLAAFSTSLMGCGSSTDETSTSLEVSNLDASGHGENIAYFNLSNGTATTLSAAEAFTGDWHISYQKYRGYAVNGGISGNGINGTEIESCIAHEYTELYDNQGAPVVAEFEALNAENTLVQFESVTTQDCNDLSVDIATTPTPIGSSWYTAEGFGLSIPANANGWVIQSAAGTFARVTPKEYNGGVILTVETWDAQAESWNAAVDSPAIDYYGGTNAYFDFDTNTAGDTTTSGWDIYVKNTNHYPEIILASDASVAYYVDASDADAFVYESVDQLTSPTNTQGVNIYKWYGNTTYNSMTGPGDLGGIEMHGDYTSLNYYPTYTTYLIKEGTTYYKVQILGYKGIDGTQDSGNIVLRHIQVSE